MGNTICKIVYFDEDSVTDYVQIMAGGKLEKTTELLNETKKNVDGKINAGAKGGITGIFSALVGLEARASIDTSIGATLNTSKMAKNIVKNTILTDFLAILNKDINNNFNGKTKLKGTIKNFKKYKISIEKNSLSYMVMVSPYFSMFNDNSTIQAGELNIEAGKLDDTLKSAKGYYEFIGTKGENQVILRFNINSLKNNYKISDLLKMDLSIYAIKVGESTLEKLNINKELDIDIPEIKKINPSYEEVNDEIDSNKSNDKILDVYDVLLAGVEVDD
ncbi:hypothetical protein KCL53_001710 [Clostridium perfringens]|uniref:DUF6414 family protein n=1 Tax=Clostridium perfringens TaxID=1502 RepID=UPI001DA2A904|nr:DUF6414 family protein [Clostridium perfringens]EHK2348591.1 hypothetical protein [Clostridium perfringens]MCX0401975.1 DUF6414 family protein [Clostridium perfringens]MDU4605101.1 DUF6414 family protein [Clostridium perfringens]MDU7845642.1 DUF6414 family protein [Clostridium perfringens]